MNTLKLIWNNQYFQRWGIPLILLLIAFTLRVVYPVTRPLVWADRAIHFVDAILAQDWALTYQRYHPGVTVMWLAGIPLKIFALLNGNLTPDQLLGVAPTRPGTLVNAVQAAVFPLALVTAACIALTYPLLRRLTKQTIAITGALLLVLDPFLIGYSKVIHPDALLASFMIISALCILIYLKEGNWLMLLLSGVFAGLSFLSKSPSLFMIPYTGLAVSVATLIRWQRQKSAISLSGWQKNLWFVIRTLMIWGTIAILVVIIFWPAMWVEPVKTLKNVYEGLAWHNVTVHPNPIFFNGQIYFTDPGIGYYLAAVAWKSSSITLPFLLLSILFALRRWRSPVSWPLWAMLAFMSFFVIAMGIGDYKQVAYILPAFPAIQIVAAFGLVWSAEVLADMLGRSWLSNGIIGGLLIIQAIITITSYPYFGAHYNRLLGGTRVAQNIHALQDNGEGLEVAARYLSSLPYGQHETAMIHPRNAIVFQREFTGRTVTEITSLARYRVYYVNQIMRTLGGEEWQKMWEADSQKEPLFTYDINGVTYVWVYGDPPEDLTKGGQTFVLNHRLGEDIHLNKAGANKTTIQPGEVLTVVLEWETNKSMEKDYIVFNHLVSQDGKLSAQQDNIPLLGVRPTSSWLAGEVLLDPYLIQTDPNMEPGIYTWLVGMYDSQSYERLPAYDEIGNRLSDDVIVVGEITVTD